VFSSIRPSLRNVFLAKFYDPDFEPLKGALEKIADTAWKTYDEYHKSPRTRKAGRAFADPDFELAVEWLETRANIHSAERAHKNLNSPSRILLVNGSTRSEHTCAWRIRKLRCDRHLEQTAAMTPPGVVGQDGAGGQRLARSFSRSAPAE
jgi:hypothetical protein